MSDNWKYKQNLKELYNLMNKGLNAIDICGNTALMRASRYSTDIAVVKALINAGAEIDIQNDNGKTALHSAAAFGNIEAVKVLLAAGAEPRERDISLPAQYAHLEIVKLLIDAIYEKRANKNAVSADSIKKVGDNKYKGWKRSAPL